MQSAQTTNVLTTMREKSFFEFKRFSIRHDRVAMKTGTDGVLLGAWSCVAAARRILDVGTGSGLIALMLAQRTDQNVMIDAVEKSADAIQARENFEASPWPGRVHLFHMAVQTHFPQYGYDLLVSNPPYFIDSLHPPDERRRLARHALSMNHEDLLSAATRLLLPRGKLSIILPAEQGKPFTDKARSERFHIVRKESVKTTPSKPVSRLLLEFSRQPEPPVEDEITLSDENGPTAKYRSLVGDFYLKF